MDLFDSMIAASRPQVKKRAWMDEKVMELVTVDTLDRVIDDCINAGLYALDLETEGLDNRVFNGRTEHQIVGVCLSPDGKHGYYLPVRHSGEAAENNIPATRYEQAILRLVNSEARAVFHNAKFDTEFLQFAGASEPLGEWDDPRKWEDTLILAYLGNSRLKSKGLKQLSKTRLGYEMIELNELFDDAAVKRGDLNFATLDPTWEPVVWYAASDAICTYLLHEELKGDVLAPKEGDGSNQKVIYQIEKLCVPATRWMERARIPIDKEKVAELIQIGNREWFDAVVEVYTEASKILGRDIRPAQFRMLQGEIEGYESYQFDPDIVVPSFKERSDEAGNIAEKNRLDPMEVGPNGKPRIETLMREVASLTVKGKAEQVEFPMVYDINSSQQLGLLFRELSVPGLTVTENSGQIKTAKDELDRVIDEAGEQFGFMRSIKRFREVQKALSSNLLPLYTDIDPRDDTLRVDFHAYRVDTGRFSTKGRQKGKALHGGTTFNLHSTPSTYDPNRPECLQRIREVFIARPGRKLVAIDYSGVELRIVTNLSKEPKWLAEFFRCSSCEMEFERGSGGPAPRPPARCPRCGSDKIGDLHTLTALSIYGEDAKDRADWKQLRQNGKATNFALCYGGGGNAVVRATACDKQEGWRVKNQFDKAYTGLAKWWEHQKQFARKHKFVKTALGRWYPLPDIDHEMGGFRAKAERNAINGPIQGTSADIMKLAMALIYKECKRRNWLDKVGMIVTIHDELVFDIDDDILAEAIEVFVRIMVDDTIKRVRLDWQVPLTTDVEIGCNWTVPWDLTEMQHGEVRFIGDKKIKSPDKLEDPSQWDSLPSWPESLRHLFPEAQGKAPKKGSSGGGAPTATPTTTDKPLPPNVGFSMNSINVPTLDRGQLFTHKISERHLTLGLVEKLANVINECRDGGTHPLRVVVRETNEPLFTEEDAIMVNPAQFVSLTRFFGV